MSLKEKAKTLVKIIEQNCPKLYQICKDCIGYCEFKESARFAGKWVRLEDAQQEIEEIHRKYEGLISKAEKDCADCYQELKQKLQQWMKEYEEICQDSETDYVRRCSFLEEKFEELLKEV